MTLADEWRKQQDDKLATYPDDVVEFLLGGPVTDSVRKWYEEQKAKRKAAS